MLKSDLPTIFYKASLFFRIKHLTMTQTYEREHKKDYHYE